VRGSKLSISLHYLAHREGAGRRVAFPLVYIQFMEQVYSSQTRFTVHGPGNQFSNQVNSSGTRCIVHGAGVQFMDQVNSSGTR
jgi:hypothetical protein